MQQQQGYAPQQYPPLSPGYPPQQPWYPPQQYVQQPVMMQQAGYPVQYQTGRTKKALVLAIIVAIITTGAGIFWAAAVDWIGLLCLVGWWLAHGFGLGGAGCKNACLMMTYAVFAFIYAIGSFLWMCRLAYVCTQLYSFRDGSASAEIRKAYEIVYAKERREVYLSCMANADQSRGLDVLHSYCENKFYDNLHLYCAILAILLFIISILFVTTAILFIRARSEVKTQQHQAVYSSQPPVVTYSGSQTQQTA